MTAQETMPRGTQIYTEADRPADIDAKSWKLMIEQGVVESARGENVLNWKDDFFTSDAEFDEFMTILDRIGKE